MHRIFLLLFLAAIAAAPVPRLRADTFVWNSPNLGEWTNPALWLPQGVPGQEDPADSAAIGSGGVANVNTTVPKIATLNIGWDRQAGTLRVVPGGSLETTGTGDVVGFDGQGNISMLGGTLTLGGYLHVAQADIQQFAGRIELADPILGRLAMGFADTANWAIGGTGELEVGANFDLGQGGTALFTQAGGEVLIHGSLNVGDGSAEYSFRGGTLTVEQGLRVGQLPGGKFSIANVTGAISVGGLQLHAGGTLEIGLGPATPAIETPAATLGGQLDVTTTALILPDAVIPLIEVSGNAPLTTTFANLPQGSVFHVAGTGGPTAMRINYAANVDGGPVANDVTLTKLRPGDTNFDNVVNRADLARLIRGFGSAGKWEDGDFTGDGIVGLADVLRFRNSFAQPQGAAAVPEPSALALAALAFFAIGVGQVKRRKN